MTVLLNITTDKEIFLAFFQPVSCKKKITAVGMVVAVSVDLNLSIKHTFFYIFTFMHLKVLSYVWNSTKYKHKSRKSFLWKVMTKYANYLVHCTSLFLLKIHSKNYIYLCFMHIN